MAEEQKTPEGEEELVLTEGEQLPEEEPPAPPSVEDLAQKMGWKPKEEYRGDPDKWRPADEFITQGHEIQRNLSQDLKRLRTTVDNIQTTTSDVFKQKLEDEKRDLAARYEQAFEAGDMNATFRIGKAITDVDQRILQPVTQPTVSPGVEQFQSENAVWFNKDPLATERAVRITNELAAKGYSEAYQLAEAARTVRNEFPQLFEAPRERVAPSTHSSARTSSPATGKKGFTHMPMEAQQVALRMEEDHGVKKELYAQNYFANLERSQKRG